MFDYTPTLVESKLIAAAPILALVNPTNTYDVRALVKLAEDDKTPPRILSALSTHEDARIRAAVADNPNIPYESLIQLARDESHDIRYQVAENHNVPVQVISILAEDDNPYVRVRAEQTLNRLGAPVAGSFMGGATATGTFV
jgi:HEAT repeat protein